MIAKYRCLNKECRYEWTNKPGWQMPGENWACPKCKGLYCEWLNYDQLFPIGNPPMGV